MKILKNLSLKTKLACILFFPLCTILWTSIAQVTTTLHEQEVLQKDEKFTEVSVNLGNIIEALQKERGVSYLYLSGKENGLQERLSATQLKAGNLINSSQEKIVQILGQINSKEFVQSIQVALAKLSPILEYHDLILQKKITPDASLEFYNSIIDEFLEVMDYLRRDNHSLGISNAMEAYIILNHYSNILGLERIYVGRILINKESIADLLPKIHVARNHHQSKRKDFQAFATVDTEKLLERGIDKRLENQIDALIQEVIQNKIPEDVSAERWFELMMTSITTLDTIKDQTAQNIIDEAASLSNQATRSLYLEIFISVLVCFITIALAIIIIKTILIPVRELWQATQDVLQGNLDVRIKVVSGDEIGDLSKSFNEMVSGLETKTREIEDQNWIKGNVANISTLAQSCESLEDLAGKVISHLAETLKAGSGAFYIVENNSGVEVVSEEEDAFCLAGTYAYTERNHMRNRVKYGESLVGQCAIEKQMIILNDVPRDYLTIESGLGCSKPLSVSVVPVKIENRVLGVIELACFHHISELDRVLFKEVADILGLIINNIMDRKRTKDLLAEAQALSEETRIQSDELRAANEQLEEKTRELERQKDEVELKNSDIEKAKERLQQKTKDLEAASQYKSDFLANMSHELRTPLNSLLLLSQMLAANEEGNLTEDQLESLRIVHNSGQDLLQLINDILDLSKVEAGKLSIDSQIVGVKEIVTHIKEQFDPISKEKKLPFCIDIDPTVPNTLQTDMKRVEQILRNLLSNAFKFTHEGSVSLQIFTPQSSIKEGKVLAFEVTDTGIGIPQDKIERIFGAFQQLDSSITRKYGGTGLGLTISRKLSQLLGGRLECTSEPGKGSVFTLYLPLENRIALNEGLKEMDIISPGKLESLIQNAIEETKGKECGKALLIIEDDLVFANIIQNIASAKGYDATIAESGVMGIQLAEEIRPDGIILDLGLSDIDGLTVLDKLKHGPKTMDIPVHIISGRSPENVPIDQTIGFLSKPINDVAITRVFARFEKEWGKGGAKQVLIVENDETCSSLIAKVLIQYKIKTTRVESCIEAKECLRTGSYDCIVLDLGLPDMDGAAFLSDIRKEIKEPPPIIVYTGRELTKEDYQHLRQFADSVILKDGKSLEILQNEISMFLQEVDEKDDVRQPDRTDTKKLLGRTVLIVDDDSRNAISLVKIFKSKGIEVVTAENGLEGVNKLESNPSIELVIMDIMMPVMNGFEAIKKIRSQEKYRRLPIVALTAKAMSEDGKQCIEAGANEYLTKPVDMGKLLSIMNVWLPKKEGEPSIK